MPVWFKLTKNSVDISSEWNSECAHGLQFMSGSYKFSQVSFNLVQCFAPEHQSPKKQSKKKTKNKQTNKQTNKQKNWLNCMEVYWLEDETENLVCLFLGVVEIFNLTSVPSKKNECWAPRYWTSLVGLLGLIGLLDQIGITYQNADTIPLSFLNNKEILITALQIVQRLCSLRAMSLWKSWVRLDLVTCLGYSKGQLQEGTWLLALQVFQLQFCLSQTQFCQVPSGLAMTSSFVIRFYCRIHFIRYSWFERCPSVLVKHITCGVFP